MRNRAPLLFLTALLLALFGTWRQTRAEDQEPMISLAAAPSGSFRIVRKQLGGSPLWLVPEAAPERRVALPAVRFQAVAEGTSRLEETSSDEFAGLQLPFISPDENWIYVQLSLDETTYVVGWLYHKADSSTPEAPRYELADSERLDTLAWRRLCEEKKIREKDIGVPDQFGHKQMSIAFGAWSEDSGRLLIVMRGGVGARKEPMGDFPALVGPWFCYFNTRTKTLEETDRIRAVNAGTPQLLLTAESIGQEGPEISAQERFAQADEALNSVYATLMKTLAPDAKAKLLQEQREWLNERDLFALAHANQSWSPFPAASGTEGRAIATEKRVAELRQRMGSPGGR